MGIKMVFCDREGRIYDHPELELAGMDGPHFEPITQEQVIPIPRGSDLMILPGRSPIGIDPSTGKAVVFSSCGAQDVFAASVFMAPAHVQTYRAAYLSQEGAPTLPLFAYTALGFASGKFYAAGFRVDNDRRQDPWRFDRAKVELGVAEAFRVAGENRLLQQLRKCALEYNCRAAQNFFLGRYEAPLPVSTSCNSRCAGCLSLQEEGTFRASHDRLSEPPTPEEVAEVALMHFEKVDRGVVSFGQGCEGEPLLMGDLVLKSIDMIRKRTPKGTINLNTNGSIAEVVEKLIDAGLDSLRVSINSSREELYAAYYRPRGYGFEDVVRTIETAGGKGCFVSLNLLVFPGVTDTDEELESISKLIERSRIEMIQMRNLNIDPEVYVRYLPLSALGRGLGICSFMEKLQERFPGLRFGYFNPPKEEFHRWNRLDR